MSITTVQDLEALLTRYEDINLLRKHNIEALYTDPHEFAEILKQTFRDWYKCVQKLKQLLPHMEANAFAKGTITASVQTLAEIMEELVDQLAIVKGSIGPVTLEDVQNQLEKKIKDSFTRFEFLLWCVAPSRRGVTSVDGYLEVLQQQKWTMLLGEKQFEKTIERAAAKALPKENPARFQSSWWHKFLDSEIQVLLLVPSFALAILLALNSSPFGEVIFPYLRYLCLGLAIIWFLLSFGSLRRRRRVIQGALNAIIWISLLALLMFNSIDLIANLIDPYKNFGKLFIWVVTIIWFPVQFLGAIKNYRVTSITFYGIFWGAILAIWIYGLFRGFLVALFLLIVPLSRLLNASKSQRRELPQMLMRQLYLPSTLSLLAVGLVVTHEILWLLGAVIWLVFAFITRLSFKHFRRTYDLIEEEYSGHQGRDRKSRFLLVSLLLSIIVLFPGLLGKLSSELIANLYLQASGLAFALITILLAIQAIVPGITTWSGEKNRSMRLREMKSVLRANSGLEGFMQLFFWLFLVALIGWLITTRFFPDLPVAVDLSFDHAFEATSSIIDAQ